MKEYDQKVRAEMQRWMSAQETNYNIGITVVFNKDNITEQEAWRYLKNAFGYYYRKTLGKKWYLKKDNQYAFIGCKEMGKYGVNLHYHLMLALVPYSFCAFIKMNRLLNKGLRKHILSGHVFCWPLMEKGWGSYLSKEVKPNTISLFTQKDLF